MASLGQGKRLTAKSLRVIQRGISAVSALSGGAESSVHSFSFETEESDDDDILSVIDMDFWIIPNGWEEYFDTETQNSYYLNTITQVEYCYSYINFTAGILSFMIFIFKLLNHRLLSGSDHKSQLKEQLAV
jgi:hypothetical protein